MAYTQENRLIAIDTPLGTDVLLLAGFNGEERLSQLFNFELNLISENHKITFEDIIGKSVTLSIILADGDKRYFNGIIARFSQGRGGDDAGGDPRFSHYWATMVPWFWLLTMTTDSRIFQKLSVPDIVEKIFKEKGFAEFKMKLNSSYSKRDYCVQYRESDFNFVSRLLEDEGIYYYFEHENGKHTMIIADTPQDHKPCPKQTTARYQLSAGGWMEEDVITSLEIMKGIRPAKYSLSDYNFEIPNTGLEVNVPSKYKIGPGEREIYDYPGSYAKKKEGDRITKIRMEEEEAKITVINGSSNCRAFTSGYRFTLSKFYRDDMNNKEYVLTSLKHEANQGFEGDKELSYANQFTCMPFDVPYRPPRITEKPIVKGSQTAIVVGPSGEEIYTDEHARVKVQFHWDREGKKDENSSCWIRVSQVHAGVGFGGIDIPRIGEEVIIDFLEGNPDLPMITGRVYNGMNRAPTGLPSAGMVSGLKSNSTPGGGGYNELTMDDTKGNEKITIHGQYNMDTTVENDQTNTINNNRTTSIAVDDSETVGSNQTINVGADQSVTVGSNQTINVGADQSVTIGSNQTTGIGSNHTVNVGANESITVGSAQSVNVGASKTETIAVAKALSIGAAYQVSVGAAMNESVGGAKAEEIGGAKIVGVGAVSSENVGANKSTNAGGNISETAGGKISMSAGGNISASSKAKVVIDAASEIILKCGGSSIVLKSGGDIVIKGTNIKLDGSGKIDAKAGGTMTLKGSTINEN